MVAEPAAAYEIVKTLSQLVYRYLLLILLILMSAGCTNSKIVLSTIYNRVDNQIRSEFNKLGKFEDWQKEAFEKKLQTYHYWHRRQELPRYANLLNEISSTVKNKGSITQSQATSWNASLEGFVESAQGCYPAHFSADLMATLKPDQISFIERRFARERYKNRAKHDAKTRDQRMQERFDQIEKWSTLAGFQFTARQEALMLASMHKTKSLHSEYYKLTDRWNKTLFRTIRQKNNPQYERSIKQHLGTLFELVEKNNPEKLQHNRQVWRDFFIDFEASLTNQQRSWLTSYLKTLSKNLKSLSRSSVKFKPHTDASQGCIPESGA